MTGSIIIVTDRKSRLYQCLLTIEEVRAWGVIASLQLPPDTTETAVHHVDGKAFIRLGTEQFSAVGGRNPFFLEQT